MPVLRDSPPSLSRIPVSFPTHRAGSPRAPALRQGVEAMLAKGTLEIALVPGPGFSSRLFLVEKASGSWRPSYSVHDGNSSFCTVICQRRGFSSFPGSEGCLPSDPNFSFLEEAMGFTSEGTVISSTPCVSDSRPLPRSALRSSSA